MTSHASTLRKASARIEALELRTFFSGEIDHAFGAGGLVNVHDSVGAAVIGNAVAVQADGKTVVAGHLDKSPNTAVVTRYNTNGSLDTTFGNKGYATVANVKAYNINGVTLLGNGKITISGQTFFRLTPTGSIDSTFSGDGVNASVLAADRKADDLVQADGSYFELSSTFNPSGDTVVHDRLYKFKADGTPDTSFATGGRFDIGTLGNVNSGGVATDAQGRVYVSFQLGNIAGESRDAVARLTPAGKLDTTYGTGGIATTEGGYSTIDHGIVVLKDGRVLITDSPNTERNTTNTVVAFAADGKSTIEVDVTNGGGVFFVKEIAQAADGSIYLGGRHGEGLAPEDGFDGLSFAAVQHLTADLKIDTKYSPDKDAIGGFRVGDKSMSATRYSDFAITASGDVVVLGETGGQAHRSDVVRLEAAGKPNHTFTSVSGNVLTVNGSTRNDHIVAYHVGDGGIDSTGYYQTVIRFDDDGVLMSADATYYGDVSGSQSDFYSAFSKIVVNLGDGNDVFDGTGLLTPVLVHGNNGNDRIVGTILNDSLYGDSGVDTLIGNGGDDVILS